MEQIEFKEYENQKESDEDIHDISQDFFSSAVLSGNDWTTETIINQINKGNIQLNPNFQRRDAWDKTRKSKFIESLILGLPVPQVVLAESKERRGSYIVLDGKQRLLSIRQFSALDSDNDYHQLKLSNLEIRDDLNGNTLESLRNSIENYDDVSAFENQPIRTVVIKNWPNESFLYHIFLRLNTGSVPLSPQELRQALHPGPFVSYLDTASTESNCLREILKITKPDFRMRDTELLLRYISYKNFLSRYTGSLKDFLDLTCRELNSSWEEKSEEIRGQVNSLEMAHNTIKSVFGNYSYKKWTGTDFESRFNRSIYDIMTYTFSDQSVRDRVAGKEADLLDAFKQLCAEDYEFRSSIESTTKSVGATQKRLSSWIVKINEVLDCQLHVPQIIDGKII